jgi:hypothetical protein
MSLESGGRDPLAARQDEFANLLLVIFRWRPHHTERKHAMNVFGSITNGDKD